mgnify:CR=1 FL=1
MPKNITFIIPIITTNQIDRCLYTLYKYTENFYCYIIDQSIDGVNATELRNKYKNLMVIRTPRSDYHWTGNLGFAQATNLGVKLIQTPYFCMLNDDVEMISSKWLPGVWETFDKVTQATPEKPPILVNPASIRLADWSVGKPSGEDFDIIPYKDEYTKQDWDFLVNEPHYINEHLTIRPGSVIDGVTMYCTVVDTKKFLEVGLLPEQLYPGGGEDYWYSALINMHGYRGVGTTLSWVFHHWSTSFKDIKEKIEVGELIQEELKHNNNHQDWGPGFDIWGYKCSICQNHLQIKKDYDNIAVCSQHPEETYTLPESLLSPL